MYAALQTLGIATEDATELLLLVEVYNNQVDKQFTDMKAPVSEALGTTKCACFAHISPESPLVTLPLCGVQSSSQTLRHSYFLCDLSG